MPVRLLLLSLVLAACSDSAPSQDSAESMGHGVLVIAVDALRADHLSTYGYDRRTMRGLDELSRKEGMIFEHAWSTGPGVVPSHVSLLTGCDPHVARQPALPEDPEARTPLFNWFLPDAVPRLAEEFLARGWLTGAFIDHPSIAGLRGYRRGFYDFEEAGGEEGTFGFEGVATRFVKWLEQREPSESWFGYVHMNDLERMWISYPSERQRLFEPREEGCEVPPAGAVDPVFFAVPRPRVGMGTRPLAEYEAEYDSALSQLDRSLARLFGRLQVLGRFEHTTVIVVGSFGFGFGESGLVLDSGALHPCDLHVPLYIRPAPAHHEAVHGRSAVTVSLMDIAPTALDLAGIEVPATMHGQSLRPVLEGRADEVELRKMAPAAFAAYPGRAVAEGPLLFESSEPAGRPGPLADSWSGVTGAASTPRQVLHDLRQRAVLGRMTPVVSMTPEVATRVERMEAFLEDWSKAMTPLQLQLHLVPLGLHALAEEDLAMLQARGWIP